MQRRIATGFAQRVKGNSPLGSRRASRRLHIAKRREKKESDLLRCELSRRLLHSLLLYISCLSLLEITKLLPLEHYLITEEHREPRIFRV